MIEAYCHAHSHASRDEETICSLNFQLEQALQLAHAYKLALIKIENLPENNPETAKRAIAIAAYATLNNKKVV